MTVWIINQLKSKFKYYSLKKCSMVVSIVDELEDYESIWKIILETREYCSYYGKKHPTYFNISMIFFSILHKNPLIGIFFKILIEFWLKTEFSLYRGEISINITLKNLFFDQYQKIYWSLFHSFATDF